MPRVKIDSKILEGIHRGRPIGERLHAARQFLGHELAEVAEIIGTGSRSAIAAWEAGNVVPNDTFEPKVEAYIEDALFQISGSPKMGRPWFAAKTFSTTMLALIGAEGPTRFAPLQEGERRLSWLVIPKFQRPPVWNLPQKVRFIESAWGGYPLASWVYNRTQNMNSIYDGLLLDGQQRITAIMEYVNDGFPVNGYLYSELMPVDRRVFSMISFPSLETSLEDPAKLEEIYDRLAYGGTPHEPKQ